MRSFVARYDWGEAAQVEAPEASPMKPVLDKKKKQKKSKSKRKDRVSGRR